MLLICPFSTNYLSPQIQVLMLALRSYLRSYAPVRLGLRVLLCLDTGTA